MHFRASRPGEGRKRKVQTSRGLVKKRLSARYPDRGYGPGLHRIELTVTLENGAQVHTARFVQQPPVPGPGHS